MSPAHRAPAHRAPAPGGGARAHIEFPQFPQFPAFPHQQYVYEEAR
ncbi:hypothetical protein AB0912_19650 [Streptomyces sp. NPDC007084]